MNRHGYLHNRIRPLHLWGYQMNPTPRWRRRRLHQRMKANRV